MNGTKLANKIKLFGAGALGIAGPLVIAWAWLWHYGSVHVFLKNIRPIEVLHGELGRRSIGYLFTHCASPVFLLFLFAISFAVTNKSEIDRRQRLLYAAALCGLISYIAQGKGFPYQRYPFLACLLILISLNLSQGIRRQGVYRIVATGALIITSIWFGPRLALLTKTFDDQAPFEDALGQFLKSDASAGSIQCLDTYGGCINTLYDLRTVQATGYLYDCYLFTRPSDTRTAYRARFEAEFERVLPKTVVVTNQACFDSTRTFARIDSWPEFDAMLKQKYTLATEWHSDRPYRMWSRREVPLSFRIYRLKEPSLF